MNDDTTKKIVNFSMVCTFNNFVTNMCECCSESTREILQYLLGRLPQVCVFLRFLMLHKLF
jgi:hypothetical protein